MTGHASLLARAALGVLSVTACGTLISSRKLLDLPVVRFDRFLNAGMVASRLGLYLLLYFVLRFHPRGDILGAYTPEAFSTYNGLLVYRDFSSSYAPLHTFLDAFLFHLWPSPLCLILFAVCVEILLLPVWLRAARAFLQEREIRLASLLYLGSPLSIQFVAVDGQDNVAVALLIALAVLFLIRYRAVLSALLFSLSVVLFKFLPLIFLPSFSLAADKAKWKWLASFAVPVLLIYGFFQAIGAPILTPLQREGALRKAGCLPYLVETLAGRLLPTKLWDGLVAASLLVIMLLVVRLMLRADKAVRLRLLFFSMPCFLFALVLLAKKSWPPYLIMAFFPICFIVASLPVWKRFLFLAFSLLALMEHSFWSIQLHEVDALHLHQLLARHNGSAILLLLVEVSLLSGYVWLWSESLRQFTGKPSSSSNTSANAPVYAANTRNQQTATLSRGMAALRSQPCA